MTGMGLVSRVRAFANSGRRDRRSLVVFVDGVEKPAWALRAGQRIIATEWRHSEQRMTVRVESVKP